MKPRNYFILSLFTLLLLFYPGDSSYIHIFAFNRSLFTPKTPSREIQIQPVPFVKSSSYPEISAEGAYVVDIPSFTPIYAKNEQEQLFPASTTKIITALVSFDVYKPEDEVKVQRVVTDGQVMGLAAGENISVENLLYGLLVYSGNDAAYALADHYGYDAFMEAMNKKAESLGMKNTYFKNPAGFDDFEQVTTPFDLAVAAREALKNKLLKKIASTRDITVSDNDFIYFHRLSNVNKLLGEVHGIGGLKTGFTEIAGENLVSFYKKDGHEFIIVIMKSTDRFTDTKTIVKWIDENVDYIIP